MPAVFLTTPALEISLLWPECRISKYLRGLRANEVWVSPLSHAILEDTFTTRVSSLAADNMDAGERRRRQLLAKRGIIAVDRHRRKMETANKGSYPRPNDETIRIWAKIRGLEVDIPHYADSEVECQAQTVGPDELLVFATAAAHSLPLFGPQPVDPETLELLTDLGITFHKLSDLAPIPLPQIIPDKIELGEPLKLGDVGVLDITQPAQPGNPDQPRK